VCIDRYRAARSESNSLKCEQKEEKIIQYKDVPTTCNEHYDLISMLYHALEGALILSIRLYAHLHL
jgi:hypothetical protein